MKASHNQEPAEGTETVGIRARHREPDPSHNQEPAEGTETVIAVLLQYTFHLLTTKNPQRVLKPTCRPAAKPPVSFSQPRTRRGY